MLSFFSKKKQSPESPPGEITMQGPPENNGEEFVIVENQHPGSASYPALPNSGTMLPFYPYPPTNFGTPQQSNSASNTVQTPIPYITGIPFNLSPQLSTRTNFDITQMEVDGILALMTKQMQLESDYDFKLERGILNECY